MQALLSFDKSPPFSAPLRFFLTAPLFAMLAGGLVVVAGEDVFVSRWTPAALAATHLITLGFMLQIMLGALIQVLPVVAGANLANPARVAAIVHPTLSLGSLLLAAGLLWVEPTLLRAGTLLLGLSVGIFLFAAGRALLAVPSTSPTIRGLKIALAGLAVTVLLGGALAFMLAGHHSAPLMDLTNLHAAWGLAGWVGVLLVAVAYVVVPMFQLTPGYPSRPAWWFPGLIVGLLVFWTLALGAGWTGGVQFAEPLLAVAGIAFCLLTWRLQQRRRRPRADASLRYWQLALLSCIFALVMWLTAVIWPSLAQEPAWTVFFGVLILLGGFMPFMVGMLYKIIPFLAWMHLQNAGGPSAGSVVAPSMGKLLPESVMQWQARGFFAAFLLSTAAVIWPELLARIAGVVFMAAQAGLFWNLWRTVQVYQRHQRVSANGDNS